MAIAAVALLLHARKQALQGAKINRALLRMILGHQTTEHRCTHQKDTAITSTTLDHNLTSILKPVHTGQPSSGSTDRTVARAGSGIWKQPPNEGQREHAYRESVERTTHLGLGRLGALGRFQPRCRPPGRMAAHGGAARDQRPHGVAAVPAARTLPPPDLLH